MRRANHKSPHFFYILSKKKMNLMRLFDIKY